jgi:hypothetical protein
MRKLKTLAILLGIALLGTSYAVAESSEDSNNAVTTVQSSYPTVVEIKGFETAPNGIMEQYTAVLSEPLPAGAYVEWILIPDDEDVVWNGDNIGGSIFLTFKETGKSYQLTARVRGIDGYADLGRYINITVGR